MQDNHANRPPEDVDTAVQKSTRMMSNNLYITLGLLVLLFIVTGFRTGPYRVEYGKDALTVTPPDKQAVAVAYADITGLTIEESPYYGECVEGRQDSNCWYGRWKSDAWGEYWLCIRPGVRSCLVIETAEGRYVINEKSDQATQALRDALQGAVSGE